MSIQPPVNHYSGDEVAESPCVISVMVIGAQGKMGKVTVDAVSAAVDMDCVAALGRGDDVLQSLQVCQPDVVIDFTTPDAVYQHAQWILELGARPLIGTTGLTLQQIDALSALSQSKALGAMVVPNFSIAALLMMRFSQQAAAWIPDVEIIEKHHPMKQDAPSGTAKKTAEMIHASRDANAMTPALSRGERYHDVPIHSLRLPGYFAHQQVVFSGLGESLTLSHECYERTAMMPGVLLAVRQVMRSTSLVYGLEHLLFRD